MKKIKLLDNITGNHYIYYNSYSDILSNNLIFIFTLLNYNIK